MSADGTVMGLPRAPADGTEVIGMNLVFEPNEYNHQGDDGRGAQAKLGALLREEFLHGLHELPYGTLICAHPAQFLADHHPAFSRDRVQLLARQKVHAVAWPGWCQIIDPAVSVWQQDTTLYASPFPCQTCGKRQAADWDLSCLACTGRSSRGVQKFDGFRFYLTSRQGRLSGAALRSSLDPFRS